MPSLDEFRVFLWAHLKTTFEAKGAKCVSHFTLNFQKENKEKK